MGYFDQLIVHLNRKKPKHGKNGYFGKPIIHEDGKFLSVNYNYYYITVFYDERSQNDKTIVFAIQINCR